MTLGKQTFLFFRIWILALITVFTAPLDAHASRGSAKTCRDIFGYVQLNKETADLLGRLSVELNEAVSVLSPKELTDFQSARLALQKLILADPQATLKYGQLGLAAEQLPVIREAALQSPAAEKVYFTSIYKAALAAVLKHAQNQVTRQDRIFDLIRGFDASEPKFSFYKIKREIEARYSLQDFIDCRS